ncbi:MAG: ERF family protein [Bacteroidales bacterium]|nr:ERF family protein [Bacteroidales bacterium]
MNIYQKLNEAKVRLHEGGLKKSGKNTFSKYDYFELGDFLPTIVSLEKEIGFFCQITFDTENAFLTITDVDKPEDRIVFSSPMSTASLKGSHEVQNLGAVQTYLRRYLYVSAFEIVERDSLDDGKKQDTTEVDEAKAKVEAELKKVKAVVKSATDTLRQYKAEFTKEQIDEALKTAPKSNPNSIKDMETAVKFKAAVDNLMKTIA